jgi:outer membrane protein
MRTTLKHVLAIGIASAGLLAGAASAEQGDFLIRGGLSYIMPKTLESSNNGVKFDIDATEEATFGFSLTYMLTDNWAIDLLGVWPAEHTLSTSAFTGRDEDIASTKVLPPTLSVQYHFLPGGTFRPYVGVGVNYTMFSDEWIIEGTFDIKDSTGFAAQVGADFALGDRWVFNVDVRYLDITADTTQTIPGDPPYREKFDLDPWVISAMIGYRFGN